MEDEFTDVQPPIERAPDAVPLGDLSVTRGEVAAMGAVRTWLRVRRLGLDPRIMDHLAWWGGGNRG